ncbi:MAG: aldehyde:ferredoxin oxidoreductase [Spirochaetes bacterium GWD1_61_31]|nr:MAG: aldehyde:ferredoxin oxidoreductase [Spirochaetes bacterium GWB1_60_80]OHD40082.1 MAG: aldehyde:ferredoxin oxidoreductase [Spirochaetes bacterium GWD1_61_31]OHD45870.1 MAG: aldehyde:ferredoxin oxidoreductase [Spirochaetes bacterium GWE1_60_18]OHD58413.1 MAG: aldehyde:ferredoxin oxidoreductase [Spirochaetes bacterium GWF1_60_12]HAW85394.1 aldehyde:ferredoxin oxidoreductase [Spirochaetaceae bacterium]
MSQTFSKQDFKLIKEVKLGNKPIHRGYAMRTLYVNVGSQEIKDKPVSEDMKQRFIGGKGFGLKLLWDGTKPATKWNDPENEIVIAMGPVCGNTNYPGSGKSLVVSLSPMTGVPIDSNVGGFFGPYLKFGGWDALELQGKAAVETIVFIDSNEGIVQLYESPAGIEQDTHLLAEQLTHAFAVDEKDLQSIAVVSAGRGADHSPMGLLNFSLYDKRRQGIRVKQAGRGGIGTVLRNKKIRAVVGRFGGVSQNLNDAADPAAVQRVGLKLHREIVVNDDKQCKMRKQGTAHLMEVMNDYDLLPTKNHKYGQDPKGPELASWVWEKLFSQNLPDGCWFGCTMACAHAVDHFLLETGPYKGTKVCVDGPEYETAAGVGSNLYVYDPHGILELNFYCDTYGIDTISFGTTTGFLMECWEHGILNLERTDGIDLTWGNWQGAAQILHDMADGKRFGVLAGRGVKFLADYFAKEYGADAQFLKDIALHGKGLEQSEYISKESLAQQGGYYLTNKGPQHDEAWLIFMDMVNNRIPTFENKAEALHYFPMFRTWFGLQGLCKLPWNDVEPADNAKHAEPNKVPEHVDNYRELYEAITGQALSWEGMIRMSEKVYNFQRCFNVRQGGGRRQDDYPPYRAMGPVLEDEYEARAERYDKQMQEKIGVDPAGKSTAEKVKITRQFRFKQYDSLIDAVFKRRGWTQDGCPTPEHLKNIGMDLPEVLAVVEARIAGQA